MSTAGDVLLFLGILTSGLMAGLFFGWSIASVPGLARVPDRTYVATMQSINRAILNPLFLVPFLGSVLLLGAAAVAYFLTDASGRGTWTVAAAVTYGVGVLAVTIGGNVPLNNALEGFEPAGAGDDDFAAARRAYESPWNRLHTVRAASAVLAFALASVAALTGVG